MKDISYNKENIQDFVTVIGGVNIDIIGFPNNNLVMNDSNPGKVKISLGGVGRNIAENLVKLGVYTKLISVIGDDTYGKIVLEESRKIGLDVEDVLVLKDQATSTYLAVLNEKGDMNVGISHMDIYDYIDIDFIKEKNHLIESSKVCVIDTNIPIEVIRYTLLNNKNTVFFLDTVSTNKALKIKDLIGYFHTIKPNKIEAEMLSGVKIETAEDLDAASKYFLNKGVRRVFISLGSKGLYYNDGVNKRFIPATKTKVVNATGAGDAFVASLVYSYINNYDIDYTAKFAMAAARLALACENTINPDMSLENIQRII